MRTKIIVNSMASKGSCGKRWPQIRAELERTLDPIAADDIALTRARNHATAVARDAAGAGYRRLVAVGGDGTFSEVANGVIADDRPIVPDLVLAQVPGGTSNELSRSFGHKALADACRAVASGQTRTIDIFRADAKGYLDNHVTRYGFLLANRAAPIPHEGRSQSPPLRNDAASQPPGGANGEYGSVNEGATRQPVARGDSGGRWPGVIG